MYLFSCIPKHQAIPLTYTLQCHPRLGHQSPSSSCSLDALTAHTHTPPALNQPPAQPTSFCNKVLLLTVPFRPGQSDTSHRLLSGCRLAPSSTSSSSSSPTSSSSHRSLCHFVSASPPRNGFTWPENEAGVSASGEWKRVCLCVFGRKRERRREINMWDLSRCDGVRVCERGYTGRKVRITSGSLACLLACVSFHLNLNVTRPSHSHDN